VLLFQGQLSAHVFVFLDYPGFSITRVKRGMLVFHFRNLESYVRAESYDHVVDDEAALSEPVVTQTDCLWVSRTKDIK
jgi:hypothetical protein